MVVVVTKTGVGEYRGKVSGGGVSKIKQEPTPQPTATQGKAQIITSTKTTDISKYGTSEMPGTAVIERAGGVKEYYYKGQRVYPEEKISTVYDITQGKPKKLAEARGEKPLIPSEAVITSVELGEGFLSLRGYLTETQLQKAQQIKTEEQKQYTEAQKKMISLGFVPVEKKESTQTGTFIPPRYVSPQETISIPFAEVITPAKQYTPEEKWLFKGLEESRTPFELAQIDITKASKEAEEKSRIENIPKGNILKSFFTEEYYTIKSQLLSGGLSTAVFMAEDISPIGIDIMGKFYPKVPFVQTGKGFIEMVKHPIKTVETMSEQLTTKPVEFFSSLAVQSYVFKTLGGVIEEIPIPKISKTKIPSTEVKTYTPKEYGKMLERGGELKISYVPEDFMSWLRDYYSSPFGLAIPKGIILKDILTEKNLVFIQEKISKGVSDIKKMNLLGEKWEGGKLDIPKSSTDVLKHELFHIEDFLRGKPSSEVQAYLFTALSKKFAVPVEAMKTKVSVTFQPFGEFIKEKYLDILKRKEPQLVEAQQTKTWTWDFEKTQAIIKEGESPKIFDAIDTSQIKVIYKIGGKYYEVSGFGKGSSINIKEGSQFYEGKSELEVQQIAYKLFKTEPKTAIGKPQTIIIDTNAITDIGENVFQTVAMSQFKLKDVLLSNKIDLITGKPMAESNFISLVKQHGISFALEEKNIKVESVFRGSTARILEYTEATAEGIPVLRGLSVSNLFNVEARAVKNVLEDFFKVPKERTKAIKIIEETPKTEKPLLEVTKQKVIETPSGVMLMEQTKQAVKELYLIEKRVEPIIKPLIPVYIIPKEKGIEIVKLEAKGIEPFFEKTQILRTYKDFGFTIPKEKEIGEVTIKEISVYEPYERHKLIQYPIIAQIQITQQEQQKEQKPKSAEQQIQIQQTKQIQEEVQIVRTVTIPKLITGGRSLFELTPTEPMLKVPLIDIKVKPKEKTKKGKFGVFVRQKGKWGLISFEPSVKQAVERGTEIVQKTARASFKISPTVSFKEAEAFLPREKFTPSKKEAGVIVQKAKFRISSPGEKAEITYKGIASLRSKRKIKF